MTRSGTCFPLVLLLLITQQFIFTPVLIGQENPGCTLLILDGESKRPLSGVMVESLDGEIMAISNHGVLPLKESTAGDSMIINYPSIPRQYFVLKDSKKVDTILLYAIVDLPEIDVVGKKPNPKRLRRSLLKHNRALLCDGPDTLLYAFKHENVVVQPYANETTEGILIFPFDDYSNGNENVKFEVCNLQVEVDSMFKTLSSKYNLMNRLKFLLKYDILRSKIRLLKKVSWLNGTYQLRSDSSNLYITYLLDNGNYEKLIFRKDSTLIEYEVYAGTWGEVRGKIHYDFGYLNWKYDRSVCIYPTKFKYFESYHTDDIPSPINMKAEIDLKTGKVRCVDRVPLRLFTHFYQLK